METWWWQVRFPEPRMISAILQIQGDQPSILANAPRQYVWQTSDDGRNWQDLKETDTGRERRLFRVHRLAEVCRAGLRSRWIIPFS